MDHLNYLYPYAGKKSHQEDPLTRAFLVVLKYVPMAQAVLIDMIREQQIRKGSQTVLPAFSQSGSRFSEDPKCQCASIDLEDGFLVSVLLSDRPWEGHVKVERVDRKAVYDGIIHYADDYVITLENKLSVAGYDGHQLHPAKSSVSPEVQVDPVFVNLTWPEIIRRLSELVQDGLVAGAESRMLEDLFEFIDGTARLTGLNPYDRFAVCKNREGLLLKRCRVIMGQMGAGEVEYHRAWTYYVRFAGVVQKVAVFPDFSKTTPDEWLIVLEMCPGDTTNQARSLYASLDTAKLADCQRQGWRCQPHLHFAHVNKHLVWTTTADGLLQAYLDYWTGNQSKIRQFRRDEWPQLFAELVRQRFMSAEHDLPKAEKCFLKTDRQTLNLCPGLKMTYAWPRDGASALDDEPHAFATAAKLRVEDAFSCWRQPVPWRTPTEAAM